LAKSRILLQGRNKKQSVQQPLKAVSASGAIADGKLTILKSCQNDFHEEDEGKSEVGNDSSA
jgi:hypothetical protein